MVAILILVGGVGVAAETVTYGCAAQMLPGRANAILERLSEQTISFEPQFFQKLLDILVSRSSVQDLFVGRGIQEVLWLRAFEEALASETDRDLAITWLRQRVDQESRDRVVRSDTEAETTAIPLPVQLVKITHPRMKMSKNIRAKLFPGRLFRATEIRFPYDFAVMDTPVTQELWVRVMGENTGFEGHDPSLQSLAETWILKGHRVTLLPGMPVTNVTVYSMAEFANRLSIIYGLQPAYILRGLRGRAENGTLQADEFRLAETDFTRPSGFRFPSLLESAFLTNKLSLELDGLNKDDQAKRIEEVAWVGTNSRGRLQMAAEKEAHQFPSGLVFDVLGLVDEPVHLLGNVSQNSVSIWANDGLFRALKDDSTEIHTRSGHFTYTAIALANGLGEVYGRLDWKMDEVNAGEKSHLRGFRLLRTLERKP